MNPTRTICMDHASFKRLETRWENLRDAYRSEPIPFNEWSSPNVRTMIMAARALDRARAERTTGFRISAESASIRVVECGSWDAARDVARGLDRYGEALARFWGRIEFIRTQAENRAQSLRKEASKLDAARAYLDAGNCDLALQALGESW